MGINNKLPWHISDDLRLFKKITTGHAILMGRKTFDSMGKALPNRFNIVMSRNTDLKLESAEVVQDLASAKDLAQAQGIKKLFIIGGAEMFSLWKNEITEYFVSHVDTEIDQADTFFPAELLEDFEINHRRIYSPSEKNDFGFGFTHYSR